MLLLPTTRTPTSPLSSFAGTVQLYIQLLVDTHLVEGRPLTRQDRGAVEEFIDKVSILLLKSL